MFEWTDKKDGIDDVLAEDINKIARAVQKLSEEKTIVVDQNYNPESKNAQSGIAVAEAVGDIETALDGIIAIQNSLMGGGSE